MNMTNSDNEEWQEEGLEALFQHVSPRQRAPVEVEREIRDKLQSEWRHATGRRRKRRRTVGLAIAASVVLALFISTNLLRKPGTAQPGPLLASIEKTTGDIFVQQPGEADSRLFMAEQLFAGQELSTIHGSRIALKWTTGESVRLDQNSRIELISDTEIELLAGNIYIDSSASPTTKNDGFTIHTAAGPVSHIGTQYITGMTRGEIEISVREGRVAVGTGENQVIAAQGQKLHIDKAGRQSIAQIQTYGDSWQWAEQVSPKFSMDGRTMQEFLVWVGRETGRKVEYASPQTRISAEQTLLHGSVDIEPLKALDLILQTSDLASEVRDGFIIVSAPHDF
jgi:ferric-dicitrate binding protein FerR (iron transport regulator)